MKTLLATALLLSTTTVFAHDSQHSCDVELEGRVSINSNMIEFMENDKSLYKIVDDQTLIVKGQTIQLDSYQQNLITEYSQDIRATVPKVKSIALDAVDLAIKGVNLALNGLLGEGNNAGADLTTELTNLKHELDSRFTIEKGITFDENGFDGEDFLGKDFENRIESVVENAVQQSLGSLLVAVGQEMLFSGGDMDAFEARMESFGSDIEHQMEEQGKLIEERADALCGTIAAIDDKEELLRKEIKALSDFNVISVKHNRNNAI